MRNQFNHGMIGDELTRAMIWQMNFFDVQSKIYTTITIVFERSAAGLFSGSKIEILPFYMPLANWPEDLVTILIFRCLAILWLFINTCITLFKKRTGFEIFTMMTFWDTWLSLVVLGMQMANTIYIIHFNSGFLGPPSELFN